MKKKSILKLIIGTTSEKFSFIGKELKTLNGHTDYVWSLTVLADNTLASGSVDKTIKIWDTEKGQLIKTLNGHTGHV